jgi:hypothetical protein
MPEIMRLSKGQSIARCFFWHRGQIVSLGSPHFFLSFKISNCEFNELMISTLKFSIELMISAPITLVFAADLKY